MGVRNMRYIELPEKLIILFETILEYKILVFLVAFLIVFTFLLLKKAISRKTYILLITITFLIGLGVTVITTSDITISFNDVINNIFMGIYFPSVEIYISILIIMLIAVVNAFVNKKMGNGYKINNIVMFFTLVFLFISFLLTISDNRIDVFNKESIYTNVNCLVLLQLSTMVFIFWLIISLIIYLVNFISNKINPDSKVVVEEKVNNEIFDKQIVIENDELVIDDIPKVEDDVIIEQPVIVKEEKFSLNDYKVFNRMLKTSLMLNRYKDHITVNDMLNPMTVGPCTEEEYQIYKKMLHTYID